MGLMAIIDELGRPQLVRKLHIGYGLRLHRLTDYDFELINICCGGSTPPPTTAPPTTPPPTTAPPITEAPTSAPVTTAPSTTAPGTTPPPVPGCCPSPLEEGPFDEEALAQEFASRNPQLLRPCPQTEGCYGPEDGCVYYLDGVVEREDGWYVIYVADSVDGECTDQTTAPSTTPPATTPPLTTPPATTAPNTTAPGTTAPGTTAPSTTAPGTTAPGTTAPGTTAPGTTAPGTTAPGTTAPGTTAPGTTAPGTTGPITTPPPTTPPATTPPATTAPPDPNKYYCMRESTYTVSGCYCCNDKRLGPVTVTISGLTGDAAVLNGTWQVPVDPADPCNFTLVIETGSGTDNPPCGAAIGVRIDSQCKVVVEGYYHYGGCWPRYANVTWLTDPADPFDCVAASPMNVPSQTAPPGATAVVTFVESTASPCSGTPMYTMYNCYKGDALPATGCHQEYGDWIERTIISEHATLEDCQAKCDAFHDTTAAPTTPPPTTPPVTTPPVTTPPPTTPPPTTPPPTTPPLTTPPPTTPPPTPPPTTPPATTPPPCGCIEPGLIAVQFGTEAEAIAFLASHATYIVSSGDACWPNDCNPSGECTYTDGRVEQGEGVWNVRYDTLVSDTCGE